MLLVIGVLIVIALIFGPSLWVKFVMRRYSSEKPEMPGTGGELAKHLIERFSLNDVKVEVTELGDHQSIYYPIGVFVVVINVNCKKPRQESNHARGDYQRA